jgi:hypothetical protein
MAVNCPIGLPVAAPQGIKVTIASEVVHLSLFKLAQHAVKAPQVGQASRLKMRM